MENIMLDGSRERIKIVDFGLSNTWDSDHALKTHCGSPEYAAPELFVVGQSYGPEVDLWSLGVVLYGMVTGRLPFLTPRDNELSPSEKRRHLLSQINRGFTNYQRKALVGYSPALEDIITRLLVPNVKKRISVKEVKFHSWVVGNQKLRNMDLEFNQLGAIERNSIVKRVAGMLHVDSQDVEIQLNADNFGAVGGMFNLLAHFQLNMNKELAHVLLSSPFKTRAVRSQSVSRQNSSSETIVSRPKSAARPEQSPRKPRPAFKTTKQQVQPVTRHNVIDPQVVKVAWSEETQKPGTGASLSYKCSWGNRSRKSKLQQEYRDVMDQKSYSAQPQSTAAIQLRARHTTSVASSNVARTTRPACIPQSNAKNSSVTSSSSGSYDLGEISHYTKRGNHLGSNPVLRLHHLSRSTLQYKF